MTVDEAIRDMKATVKSVRSSLAFAAPEFQDFYWNVLQQRLTSTIEELGEEIRLLESFGSHDED